MRALVCLLLCTMLATETASAAAQRVRDGDAPFCTRLDSLEAFVLTAARQGYLSFNDPACVRLRAGTRLDVAGDVATLGEVEIYAVTVHGSGGDVDGFTLSNRIEDVPRPLAQ